MQRAFVVLMILGLVVGGHALGQNAHAGAQSDAAKSPAAPAGPAPQNALADAKDVDSIDAITAALYDVISGPAGERNWPRFRSLFAPHAVLATITHKKDGTIEQHELTPDDYVKGASPYFLKEAFFEGELARQTHAFGNIAHLFSTYASRHAPHDAPFARGINSIQLLNDGQRWWVLSILWDEERPGNPLPPEYLPKK
jgi:hypothetical protein